VSASAESVWRRHGAGDAEVPELLDYARGRFDWSGLARSKELPWPDPPHVAAWEAYAEEARERGVWAVLRERLVQFRFPLREGISGTPEYVVATRSGAPGPAAFGEGFGLRQPDRLQLLIHPTPVGRVPVLIAGHRDDFVMMVQALTRRNEPEPVPDSMGACCVAGYTNWDRVHQHYRTRGAHDGAAGWSSFLRELAPRRELYQDRFILLSAAEYSGVPAHEMGLGREEWLRKSVRIRLEHECTHYLTRELLGSMRNALLDELLADYQGIVAAEGRYRADWFLRFLGLDGSSDPARGRLSLYRGTPPVSDRSLAVLGSAARACAAALEEFDRDRSGRERTLRHQLHEVVSAAWVGLEGLASADARDRLAQAWDSIGAMLGGEAQRG
jgi:hypothetical protein